MPVITVESVEEVVATPEQKRALVERLTDTFCDILGDVVRPFVYTVIEETPRLEWGIAGVPMPEPAYLTGDEHAGVIARSVELMRAAMSGTEAGAEAESGARMARADTAGRGREVQAIKADGGSARGLVFSKWFEGFWDEVATPEQKHRLYLRLADAFVDSLGEIVRPIVAALLDRSAPGGGGREGASMRDLVRLVGDEAARDSEGSQVEMPDAALRRDIRATAPSEQSADKIWRGER